MTDYTGGLSAFISLQQANLLVRCTLFLFGFITLMTFYTIMSVTKDDRGNLIIVFLSITCGIAANMIRTVLDDISSMVIANVSPVKHIEKLGARNSLSEDPEFKEEFDRLKELAQGVEDRRRGFIAAGTLANKLLLADKPQQPSGSEAG